MNFVETIYLKVKQMRKKRFNSKDVAKATGLEFGFDKRTLIDTLDMLAKDGRLIKLKNGEYELAENKELLKCTLIGTSKDYAFARPISGEKDNDIFISVANLNGACHGDRVVVEVGLQGKDRKYKQNLPLVAKDKREGRVVEILERGFKVVVGLVSKDQNGFSVVVPDDRRFTDSVYVAEKDLNGAENNTKVVLDILEYPSAVKMARGRVREILGDPKDVRVTTLSIIRSYNLFEEFPEDVEEEAKKVAIPVDKDDKSNRKDYRDRLIITIDGDDARDFDDAISVTKNGDIYDLGVYIADVSHYVQPGSKLDVEAFKRGTSVYFPDHVLPMLPVTLSNGICSLNPNEDRFTLAVEMKINSAGKIVSYEIHKGIIRSSYRMTYKKVTAILQGNKELTREYQDLTPMLFVMADLAKILISRRNNAGQLDFDIPEPEIILNKDGTVADIHRKPRELSDRIIEQFMVLTNEVVAKHFDRMKAPFVYRVHEIPPAEKVKKFKEFAGSLGLKFNASKEPSPKDFQVLIRESEGKDYSVALSKVMLRSMQKARYETENLGHFGLALKDYCHFTSPIRRYPDLTIHRIISEILDGKMNSNKLKFYEEFVVNSAEHSSTTERQAEEAERAVDDQKSAEYMQGKIGEVFEGTISGVSPNGFFVELDNTVEGFVNINRLPEGRYEYNEARYFISGVGKIYRMGDRISVRVVGVDIVLRHVDFELSDFHREIAQRSEEMLSAREYRKKSQRQKGQKSEYNKSEFDSYQHKRHANRSQKRYSKKRR